MAYIGREPLNGFFTRQVIANDGSTTTFALTHGIASTSAIIVSVNAVILQPDVGYSLSGGGTSIIFASAPNATTYIHYLGQSVQQSLVDMNGVEFILDADADTTLTADTDDEIDIKVGGTDRSTIKATGFHNLDSIKFVAGTGDDMQIYHDGSNSYVTNATGALKLATETSGIAITIGHSTSEVTIADNMTVAGDLTVTGTTSFADTNITNVGSIALDTITNDGTDITLDSSGDIILDAGGDTIFLKDSGTTFGSLDNSSSNLIIKSGTTTAATFSGANVTLAGTVGSGAITSTGLVTGTGFTAGSAVLAESELELLDGLTAGTAIASKVVTTDASIDTTGQRNLTISGELDAATLDISGNADIDGTMEADAYTLEGSAFIKVEGTNFTNSLLVGHATTGTLNAASNNTGVGINSMNALTSGDQNTAIGDYSGQPITTGSNNTSVGYASNRYTTTGNNNTAVGSSSLSTNVSGTNNTAVGGFSLKVCTGDQNAAFGYASQQATLGGDYNTSIGYNSLGANTTANYNIGIGNAAGVNLTTGSGNVIIGTINADAVDSTRTLKIAGYDGTTTTTWIDGDSSGNLTFKRVDTGDDNPYVLTLQTGETDIASADILGSINFQAPDEGTGTDAILVAAGIDAVSEGDFAADNNATKLSFKTGASEAASEKMSLSSVGLLTIADDLIVKNAGTIGTAADSDLLTMGNAILTVAGEVSMTTLDIGGTNVTSTATELNQLDGVVAKTAGKETIWIPSTAMTPTESNGAARETVETTSGRPDMNVLDFDKDADEFAQFAVAFPKSYNLGTVTFQFFWSGIAATTGVEMTLAGVAMNDNETIDVAYGTAVAVADAAQGAVEELLVSPESGAITIAGTMADNDLAFFRIGRDVSEDDMAGDCRLHGIKLHFTTDAANDA